MPKKELQQPRDHLIGYYRDIGPASLVAALMSTPRLSSDVRNDNQRNTSILAKKPA